MLFREDLRLRSFHSSAEMLKGCAQRQFFFPQVFKIRGAGSLAGAGTHTLKSREEAAGEQNDAGSDKCRREQACSDEDREKDGSDQRCRRDHAQCPRAARQSE